MQLGDRATRAARSHEPSSGAGYSPTVFFVVLRRSGPKWDASRALEEQTDWSAHAAFMDNLVDTGFLRLDGRERT